MGLFCVLRHNRYFEGRKGSDNSTTGLAGRVGGLPMTIRGGGDPLLDNGLHAAVKDGPTAPELAADAHDCIMVRSSKGRPNTRLWRDQRLIAGSPRISSPVPMPLYTDAKRACEDEDRELRRQAILGMAHYRSARAFAVNPARLKARPCGLRGLTAQRGQARGPPCQEWTEAPC